MKRRASQEPRAMLSRSPGFSLIVTIILGLSLSGSPTSAEVVAKVDGAEITSEDVALALEDVGRTLPRQLQGTSRRAYIINYLVDLRLAAHKAEQENLQKTADFERKIQYFRQKALMESYMDSLKKAAISSEKIKVVYDEAARRHQPETEVKASHILVPTKAEAETALKRVAGGEDFAKVAKEISRDTASPGGELGWFTKKKMVPAFAGSAFKTEVGKISPPVESQFGWHIIKVEGRRQTAFPKLELVRSQIEQHLNRKAQRSAIEALRKAARIEKPNAQK